MGAMNPLFLFRYPPKLVRAPIFLWRKRFAEQQIEWKPDTHLAGRHDSLSTAGWGEDARPGKSRRDGPREGGKRARHGSGQARKDRQQSDEG